MPIKDYLLRICVAAIICSIIIKLAGQKGSITPVIRLLCGLFMAVTVFSPAISVRIDDFQYYLGELSNDAEYAANIGENIAQMEMERIITERVSTYITQKAQHLGAEVAVEVFLEDSIPVCVSITGAVSPFAKTELTQFIEQNFGITSEEQQWIG